jgi:hypothetical protein
MVIKAFYSILYVLHCPFNNAFLKLLYTKNEYDGSDSKTYKPVGTTYHRLWKQDVHHILLLYVKENVRMQQTYYALLICQMKEFLYLLVR